MKKQKHDEKPLVSRVENNANCTFKQTRNKRNPENTVSPLFIDRNSGLCLGSTQNSTATMMQSQCRRRW